MADYFPVLSRAVAGLETNTAETRRAVYDRARAAITRQLRAIDPPLAEEDIAREQTQLEDAIKRIEAGAAAPSAPVAAPVRPQPPAPPADRPRADPPAAVRPAEPQRRPERPANPAPQSDGVAGDRPAQSRPAARADGRPIIQPPGQPAGREKTKRSGPLVAIAALLVIGVGAGLFAARGHIAGLLGGGTQTASRETPAATTAPENKSSDRLGQDGAPPAAESPAEAARPADQVPQQQEPTPQPEQEVARAPEPTAPPAEQPAPAAPAASSQDAPSQSGPLVAQRAVLYEEGPNQQSGEASQGTVTWRTESVSGGADQPLDTALRGDIEIPGRKLRATLTIRRNADTTLPASHTIEIQFTLPEDFPNAGISNVPGVLMKADEAARGAAVSGLSVRVTSGFFLIGLSNSETERSVNEQLLRDRGWIDIPILYDNGRRAVLTLEKGNPGQQAFQDAFSAWRSAASAAAPAPANP